MSDFKEKTTANDIEVQRLDASRWEEYKQLRLRALEREPQAFLATHARDVRYPDEKWKQRLEQVGQGKNWILFARSDGELVGMIGAYRSGEDIENHLASIWGVYVDSEMRGKGVAKKLMEGILEELRQDSDVHKVILEVNSDQESAKKLYENFGFKATETYPYVMGDGLEHQITKMVKEDLRK